MKYFSAFLILLAALWFATAQTRTREPLSGSAATLSYIHSTWATLTRSDTDCRSLADVKVNAHPVLYLPADLPTPPEVAALTTACHVDVRHLPRRIEKIGDMQPGDLPMPGLLYLPHPYVVPGGRFNEMYGWDSYFILLGLEADHHAALAKDIVDNFLFEIEHYGGVLNANRTYYLTRSQPPLLTSMIRAVYENAASFPATAQGRIAARAWLQQAYTLAQQDYSTWQRPEHKAGDTGLTRYHGYGQGPVPEMADDSDYYIDVIRWLVQHPGTYNSSFLVKGAEHPSDAESARLRTTSCDVHTSVVCMRAWYDGYRLSHDFYEGDRAMRESGFDPSFRFGPFSGATDHFAPVDLNCLLYRYERDMEHFASLLGDPAAALQWDRRAQARYRAIQRYLWQPKAGVFADYDFVRHRASDYAFITSLYPLWAGVAGRDESQQMVAKLNRFERAGGLATSNYNSGLQWDEPYGWAPTNWIAVEGLEMNGYRADAVRLARKFNATVDAGFAADHTLREKYNVVTGNAHVTVSTGYKANQVGFGWTNGVYLKMEQLIHAGADEPVVR